MVYTSTCSAGALPGQWCLSGWNGSLRVMSRSRLLWGLRQLSLSRRVHEVVNDLFCEMCKVSY